MTGLIGPRREALLALTDWPQALEVEDASEMEAVFDVVRELRTVRTNYNIPFREILSANLTDFSSASAGVLTSSASSISRMANTAIFVNDAEFARPDWQSGTIQVMATSAGSAPLSTGFVFGDPVRSPVREGVVSVAMPTSFDANAERARLAKEMAKCDADIARVEQKLGNADFLKRAPEDVVEGEREKREEAQARREKLAEALERLKGAA